MKQRLIRRGFAAFLALCLAGGFSFGADGGRKESARFFGISEACGEEAAEAAPVEVLPVEESAEPVQIESFEQTENPEQKSSAGENSPVQSGSSGQGDLREESGAPARDSGGNESGNKNIEESAGGKEKAGTEGSGSSGESSDTEQSGDVKESGNSGEDDDSVPGGMNGGTGENGNGVQEENSDGNRSGGKTGEVTGNHPKGQPEENSSEGTGEESGQVQGGEDSDLQNQGVATGDTDLELPDPAGDELQVVEAVLEGGPEGFDDEPEEESAFTLEDGVLIRYNGPKDVRELTIPDGTRAIGANVFQGMSALETVILPDSVTEIRAEAFADCGNLKKLYLPDSVTDIEEEAFAECVNLKEIRLSENSQLSTVGKRAFYGDTALEFVILPGSVTEICEEAFANCSNLEVELYPNSNLSTIGPKAFLKCEKLNQTFETKVRSIADNIAEDAFKDVPETYPTPKYDPEPEVDPYEEIEWESSYSFGTGGKSGGGTGKRRQTHGRSRAEMKHDYGQVWIGADQAEGSSAMHVLTLDGEELAISLDGADGSRREFTVSLGEWRGPETGENPDGNLLILRAAEKADAARQEGKDENSQSETANANTGTQSGEDGKNPARGGAETGAPDPEEILWRVNGAALRTLSRSGIEYLAFRRGDQVSVIPTENLLAGWAYNELKSRGTAGRRFDFTLSMGGGDQQPRWQVAVGEQEYELGQDELAPMYMPGAENGTAELLNPTRAGKR